MDHSKAAEIATDWEPSAECSRGTPSLMPLQLVPHHLADPRWRHVRATFVHPPRIAGSSDSYSTWTRNSAWPGSRKGSSEYSHPERFGSPSAHAARRHCAGPGQITILLDRGPAEAAGFSLRRCLLSRRATGR